MSNRAVVTDRRDPSSGAAPTWWLVFLREFSDLWIGGRALVLMFLFCILQGGLTYLLASDSDPTTTEKVYFALCTAIAVGLFMSLIIGADSISGERERATLEGLLLTPTSRRQLVVGKFLAAVSPWPVAFAITIPYLAVLSHGDEVFGHAVLWGAVMGTILAPSFTGFGMIVSFWSNSNKTSLFVSLVTYFAFLMPTLLPGGAQTGMAGRLLKRVNPMESNGHFLEKVLVNNRTLGEFWPWLASPVLFAVLVYGLLFYASPGLQLEAGRTIRRFQLALFRKSAKNPAVMAAD